MSSRPTPVSAATNRDSRGQATKLPNKPQPEWTSFTNSYTGMLNEIKGTPLFEAPKPMQAPADLRDKSKRCEYHKDHIHHTEDCISLKYFIERLAKGGKLNQYLS